MSNMKPAFILPAVLFVISALLILAVGLLLNIGLERHSARSYLDYQRAELAATAGLEHIKASLKHATSNDTFLVLEANRRPSKPTDRQPAPRLFIAQGQSAPNNTFTFSYLPLFSATRQPADTVWLSAPDAAELTPEASDAHLDISPLPYLEPLRLA